MKLNNVFLFTAVVALVFGVGFYLVPGVVMSMYGITLDSAEFVARYLGSAFLGYAVLDYLATKLSDKSTLRTLVLVNFVVALTGLIMAIYETFAGASNQLVWLNVALYGLIAIGFGYFQFSKAS